MIIDVRCRYLTPEGAKYFAHSREVQAHETPESFFAWLDKQGVDVVLSPVPASLGLKLGRWDLPARSIDNDGQADMQKRFPRRFVGVAGIDPGNEVHDGLQELERCVNDLGLKVAAIEPGRKPMLVPHLADRSLYDFYTLASELNVPVILQTSGLKGGVSIDYAHPRWIDQIAHDFPELHIICAHGCVPYLRELALVTRRRPNVFASPDLYTFMDFNSCQWVQPGQLIFGSGYPFIPVERMKMSYLSAPWARTHNLDDMMYKNALRALKLENNVFFADKLKSAPVFKPVEKRG
jgi:predicted TIM-barrel fold metal-dependent hydrolase